MAEDLYGPLPDQAISMDVDAFDRLVRSQGLTFVHYRAVPCPMGMVDPTDLRQPHEDHVGCSNGNIYVRAGEITAAFAGNRKDSRLMDLGLWSGSAATVTVPRFYDNDDRAAVFSPGDRMYVRDSAALVVASQRFQAHESGIDRLRFPAADVEYLIDYQGEEYAINADFVLEGGRIKWTGTHRPQRAPGSTRGAICAIRYRYIPFWYVETLLHELRLIQVTNPATGERSVRRVAPQLLLQRENVYEGSQKNDPQSVGPEAARQSKTPASGSFGPR